MSTTVTPAQSWLNTFDPTNPASLTSLLNTSIQDPANNSVPAGFDVLQPTTPVVQPTVSTYQQALAAFQTQADTYLIQSALSGGASSLLPLLGSSDSTGSSSSDLSNALQAAALQQQQAQQAQQQSALTAAQNALDAATGVDAQA